MAEYDGSIRIKTQIDSKNAAVQLATLENRISKTADKIAGLRSKMDALKDAKIPTQEYQEISAQIEKAEHEFDKLLAKQEQMQNEGKDNGASWQRLNDQMEEVGNTIRYAKGELQDLVDTGKAFTLGSDTQEYSGLSRQLKYAEKDLSVLNQKHEILNLKQRQNIESYKRMGTAARYAFNTIFGALNKVNTAINSFSRKLLEVAKKHLPLFHRETSRASESASRFGSRIKSLALSLLIFNQISKAFRAASSAIMAGFTNFYNENERFRASIDSLNASLATLKNALASAFAPIVEIAIPYIQRLVDWLTQAVTLLGQFVSAILGRKTYTRAVKQSAKASGQAADATKEESDAIEEETEEIDKQLSPLDKLNNLTSEKNKNKSDSGKLPETGTAGGAGGVMFEEVPIEGSILDASEKLKDILSRLFAPIKKAWKREGEFVMNAWKKALKEVWDLVKDIGRDFLRVWEQPATVDVLADILHIIGDIGLVVANLARNFRAAWNENEVGFHILEKIRDIIGIIVKHIRNAADATVEWADKLDFYPILDAIDRFLESIKPVVDAVWGVLEDFYTMVLLPLGKWTLEKGLPELLQVFIDFNNKVDWESLRENLAEFWKHLEPFAETVGEGLIIFIDRVSDALADFLNSEEFKDFLQTVEEWMDSVSPEDVADALEKVAKGLVTLKLALLGYSAIKGISSVLTTVKTFLSFFGVGGGAAGAGAAMEGTASSLGVLAGAISDFGIATGTALAAGELVKDKMWESAEANGVAAQAVEDSKEHYDGFLGSLKLVKDELGGLVMGMQGLPNTLTSSVGAVDALNKAMEATANGTIYTDEQMQKMQSTWGFTAEDMEMLRQSMLDTNPELREIADNFGLVDASAQTLGQIEGSMKLVNDRILETSELSEKMKDFIPVEVTDDAQAFFDAVSNGTIDLETYQTAMENTSGAVQQFSADMVEASTNIGAGLTQGMENVDTDTPATGFFNKLVASIKSIFGIASPAANMNPLGENIILGVVEGFKAKITEFNTAISQMFTQISAKFTSGLSALKNVWTSAWSALPNTLKGIINQIMSMLSSLMSSISSAFSRISSFGSKVGSKVGGMFKGISAPTGVQIPVSPVVAALSDVEIPAYATGQVIPRTMKQHLAVLGDNTRETEVVSPLSTIEQAVTSAMAKAGFAGGQDINLNLTVECEGYQLLNIMQKLDRQFYKQNGRHAFS